MPMDRSRYHPRWEYLSRYVRVFRAEGRCECRGQCGHGDGHDLSIDNRCDARNGERHPVTGSTVVLTVAHLDHDPANNDEANLLAMCQRCHLAYDAELHRRHAHATRRRRRARADLFAGDADPNLVD